MRSILLAIMAVMLMVAPASASTRAEKQHKLFHFGVLWPLRVIGYCAAGPIMVPVVLAERFDKNLEQDLAGQKRRKK
jgi:hypothetical protein